MRALRDVPIKRKLTIISMAASGAALLLATAAFVSFEYRLFKEALVTDLQSTAQVLGDNSAAALAFDYPGSAQVTLESISVKPHILAAAIYDTSGRVFAAHIPGATGEATLHDLPPSGPEGWEFGANTLDVVQPIMLKGETLGAVAIRSSLDGLRDRLWLYAYIAGFVLGLASLAAYVLATWLQRGIVQPVSHLATVIAAVAKEKDYSIRAAKDGVDELGQLVDGFNEMLNQIQLRDSVLSGKNVELERAIKAKDMFLANMSHELRTPLNAIIGFTGTLLMRLPGALNATQEEQLGIVQGSARHLLSLINDLLDLSKIESGKFQLTHETVSCRQAAEDTIATLRPLAEQKQLVLGVQVPEGDVRVVTDRRALRQILLNFCNNAIKFTEAGSVTLTVARTQHDGAAAVEISVTDTGIGVRPDFQDKLFQAFSQMDSSHREGTGLGLHLSQRLAGLIGGRIGFSSQYGRGSRFWLTLPLERRDGPHPDH